MTSSAPGIPGLTGPLGAGEAGHCSHDDPAGGEQASMGSDSIDFKTRFTGMPRR
jgi:hypothetical protein